MEYVALFVWLVLCQLIGGLMHTILQSPFNSKLMRVVAAPGVVVRKLAMTVTALLSGATVTQVSVYNISNQDIGFHGNGAASVSKVLVPLGPLFACAVVLQIGNVLLGSPLSFDYTPPSVPSLDVGGVKGFLLGLWALLSGLVEQGRTADWGSLRLYLLLALVLNLSLGACASFGKIREAIIGALLVVVGLAVVCALFGVRSEFGAGANGVLAESSAAAWMKSLRSFMIRTGGAAFIMMLCGIMVAIVVGIVVRLYELATAAMGGRAKSSESRDRKKKVAA